MHCVRNVCDDLYWIGGMIIAWLYLKISTQFQEEFPIIPIF